MGECRADRVLDAWRGQGQAPRDEFCRHYTGITLLWIG
jgi:hypothetical protein